MPSLALSADRISRGGLRVPKRERRGAVRPDDLGLGHEVFAHLAAKGEQVVRDKTRRCQQQRKSARQHRDQHELPLDRQIANIHALTVRCVRRRLSLPRTIRVATFKQLRADVQARPFRRIQVDFETDLLSSTMKLIVPPRRAKSEDSPTTESADPRDGSVSASLARPRMS